MEDAALPELGKAAFTAALPVSRETLAALERYAELLTRWNPRINLVGPDTLPDLWIRHFLDSAQLLSLLPPPPAERPRRIVDLGSGAGFPGLVLALLGAGDVTLVESDGRKATFLREAARVTGAQGVSIRNQRIETLSDIAADVVTARACAPLARLLDYAAPLLARRGICLFLKGQGADAELTALGEERKIAVERFPSATSSDGVILRIGGIEA